MISLSDSVGKGAANNADDVAFLQFALRLAKKSKGQSFFAGNVNGVISDPLWLGLKDFLVEAGYVGAKTKVRSIHIRPKSAEWRALVTAMPARFRRVRAVGRSSLLHLPGKGGTPVWPAAHDIPLPTKLKAELLAGLRRLWDVSRLFVTLDTNKTNVFEVLPDGRFFADLTPPETRWLDGRSLAFGAGPNAAAKSYVLHAITKGTGWRPLTSGRGVQIVSVKKYPSLAMTDRALRSHMDHMNYRPSVSSRALPACVAAAHLAYLRGDQASRKTLDELKGCFSSWHGGDPTSHGLYARELDLQLAYIGAVATEMALIRQRMDNQDAWLRYQESLPHAKEFDKEVSEAREQLGLDEVAEDIGFQAMDSLEKAHGVPDKAMAKLFSVFWRYLAFVDTVEDVSVIVRGLETLPGLIEEHRMAAEKFKLYLEVQQENHEQMKKVSEQISAIEAAYRQLQQKLGWEYRWLTAKRGRQDVVWASLVELRRKTPVAQKDKAFQDYLSLWRQRHKRDLGLMRLLNRAKLDRVLN